MKNEDLDLGILDIRVLISAAIDQQVVTSCDLRSLERGGFLHSRLLYQDLDQTVQVWLKMRGALKTVVLHPFGG